MPIVAMPDGAQVRFPDDMPKEQIRDMILQKFPDAASQLGSAAPQMGGRDPQAAALADMSQMTTDFQNAPKEDTDRFVRANLEASKINEMQGDKGLLGRAAEAIPGGATLGIADELYSGTLGGAARMMRDGVGPIEAYKREMALQAALKENRGDAANLIGDVAGGTALGGTLAKGGFSLIDKATSTAGKIGAGVVEGAGYTGVSNFGNSQGMDRFKDAATGALIGGTIGGGIPIIGAGLRAGYNGLSGLIGKIRGAVSPESEATTRIAAAMKLDKASPAGVLSADDLAAAARNNQPLMNIDRGGENTRALARSAANQSPEARGMMEKNVSDRFSDQSGRITGLMERVTGGKADDLAAQDALKAAAKVANAPAYNKAHNSPAAQRLYPPELQELMQSPAVRKAVKDVETKSANRAAVEGFKAIKNPFHEAADGSFKLRQTADGKLIAPNLRFWDQVKRNLDDDIGPLQRSGQKPLAADLLAIKSKLVNTLDGIVPEYKTARQGAAAFFGAEDALDAGKKFAKSSRMLPEYKRGIMAMKAPERELFKTGFASEIIDAAKASGDRTNVINRIFASPESREKVTMALGDKGAREVEAFVRVENAMDAARGAFGNSSTARQLVELGLVGGGTWYYTGDFNKGVIAALGAKGLKMGAQKIDERVLRKVADIMLSGDPKLIERAMQNATVSPKYLAAIQAFTKSIEMTSRLGGVAAQSGAK